MKKRKLKNNLHDLLSLQLDDRLSLQFKRKCTQVFFVKYTLLLFLFFSFSLQSYAQISVTKARDTMMIGDKNELLIEVVLPSGIQIKSIDFSQLDSMQAYTAASIAAEQKGEKAPQAQFEILDYGSFQINDNKVVDNPQWVANQKGKNGGLINRVTFTVWEEGVYMISPIKLFYIEKGRTKVVQSNPLPLFVVSPLSNADEAAVDSLQVTPMKDIIVEELKFMDFIWYLVSFLILFALAVGGYFYMRRKNKNDLETETIEVKLPAHVIALKKLEELKTKKLWQQGEVKEYQSELTHIVREYLENRYDIQALESTTYEIIGQMKKSAISEGIQNKLKDMFQMADMVKFAKAEPPIDVNEQLMQDADAFVLKTKKIEVETTVAE